MTRRASSPCSSWPLATRASRGVLAAGVIACTVVGGSLAAASAFADTPAPPGPAPAQPDVRTYSTVAGAATLRAEMTLTPGPITVAQRITLTLSASAPTGWTVQLPATEASLGDWTVASSVVSQRPETPERASLTIVLEPFLAGSKTIPPLAVAARSGARTMSVKTDALTIEVNPIAEDTATERTALEPPHEPFAVPVRDDATSHRTLITALAGAAGALLLFAAAFGGVRSARRRRTDPVRVARAALDAVHAQIAAGHTGPGLTALAATLRTYAQAHLGVPAVGRTAAELAARPEPSALAESDRAELLAILGVLDSARFAPHPMVPTAAAALTDRAGALIDATAIPGARPTQPEGVAA